MDDHSKNDTIRLTCVGRTWAQELVATKNFDTEEMNYLPRIQVKSTPSECDFLAVARERKTRPGMASP